MIVIIIIILILAIAYYYYKYEKFSSLGALTQLYAKGPQDLYLTSDTEKYVPELWGGWFGFNYPPVYSPWNYPTRIDKYYYPLFGIFPKYYY